jgi:hypothetical protein
MSEQQQPIPGSVTRCPDCNGTGNKPGEQYTVGAGGGKTTGRTDTACPTCQGKKWARAVGIGKYIPADPPPPVDKLQIAQRLENLKSEIAKMPSEEMGIGNLQTDLDGILGELKGDPEFVMEREHVESAMKKLDVSKLVDEITELQRKLTISGT